jgi:pyruvate/2-oxoglutarate/acetoin dehydrogenase E1 component
MTYLETLRSSVYDLMERDTTYLYIGEDVRSGQKGISDGFLSKFGAQRVIDTPISESGFCGMAVGLAVNGFRPIVEFNFSGLMFVCLDQIFNQAFKFKFMTGNKRNVPIIYLMPTGTKGGLAGHHSDNTYATLSHLGVISLMPACKEQIPSVLDYACGADAPVAIFLPVEEFRSDTVYDIEDINPFFLRLKCGDDVAIICTGTSISTVNKFLNAASKGIVERTAVYCVSDLNLSANCLEKIRHLKEKTIVIVDDATESFGFASQIELEIRRSKQRDCPKIHTVCRLSNLVPFREGLEHALRPSAERISEVFLDSGLLGGRA